MLKKLIYMFYIVMIVDGIEYNVADEYIVDLRPKPEINKKIPDWYLDKLLEIVTLLVLIIKHKKQLEEFKKNTIYVGDFLRTYNKIMKLSFSFYNVIVQTLKRLANWEFQEIPHIPIKVVEYVMNTEESREVIQTLYKSVLETTLILTELSDLIKGY